MQRTLDGCHLKYALENYLVRERPHMYWKAIFYSLLQLQDKKGQASAALNLINLIAIGIAGFYLGNVLAHY
ncbi:hypothetical protein [Bartonella krasnovii]|uniref:Uncharacterized protein n=1 Tax=Bartonella krasnovii TaxID=2267275 RepID=A0ABY3VXY7_9HYPH|nr:hypothetical protein [Bartonella krasnovii]UNF29231.1 hypothetical protein MNL13_00105 [Bartonella krasnovii]UNF35588.1 hypothetical protein MNL12_00105 [Bartonella krasnovii]UNF37204.1 hypothetical protein MNL11_00105 [Bartonella krasnovii]UNF38903.1 hypothetical protein MNL10_00105 [Bartonella krasnovii]UNF40631.1 hypothetical protein MNL09_00105 [Bartonella krasnovii]